MDAVRDKGVYLCLELIGSYGSDVSTASENPVPGATVANTSRILEVKCSSRYEIWKTFCGIFSDSYGKIMSAQDWQAIKPSSAVIQSDGYIIWHVPSEPVLVLMAMVRVLDWFPCLFFLLHIYYTHHSGARYRALRYFSHLPSLRPSRLNNTCPFYHLSSTSGGSRFPPSLAHAGQTPQR